MGPHPGGSQHRDSSGRRVYELLRMQIRSGEVEPDELLVDTSLVHSLHATRHAVRYALQRLADEGILDRSPRSGTRLRGRIINASLFGELHPLAADDADQQLAPGTLVVRPTQRGVGYATDLVASRLRIPVGTRVALTEQELFIDGEPVGIRSVYFLPDPDAEHVIAHFDVGDHDPVSLEAFVERVYGRPVGRSKVTVEAAPSLAGEHDALGLAPGTPILMRTMLIWDTTDRPIAITFTHLRGDRMALSGWLQYDGGVVGVM